MFFGEGATTAITSHVFALYNYFPTLALTAPNGGESLNAGATTNITWNCTQSGKIPLLDNPISLYYSTDGGMTYTAIASSLPNSGTYTWEVPLVSTTTARVKIVAYNSIYGYAQDVSDANFSIVSSGPTVSVTSPNGGEVWEGGSTQSITWSVDAGAAGLAENPITIYYSTDSGENYSTTIASGIANTGSYSWTTPTVDLSTFRVKVRALNSLGQPGEDASDADFSISKTTGEEPVITEMKSGPSPFAPGGASGTATKAAVTAKITYSLSNSADVKIYIFDASGNLKYKQDITSGEEGGHVGFNAVDWAGVDQNNNILPNGVYIIKIVSGGKVIGTDKIMILK
jgi:hypothetical protein